MASETLDRHPGDTQPDEDRAADTAASGDVRADPDAAPERSTAKPTSKSSTRGKTAPKKTAAKKAAPKKAAPKKATPKKAASRKAAAKTLDGEPEDAKSAPPKSDTESATRKPVAKRSRTKATQAKPGKAKPAKAEVAGTTTAAPAETPDQAADTAPEKAPKTVRKRKATTRKRAQPAKTAAKSAEDAASKDGAGTPAKTASTRAQGGKPADPAAPAVAESKPPAPPPPTRTEAPARSEPPRPEIREQTPVPAPQGIDAPPLPPYRAALRHLHRLVLDRGGNKLDKADTMVETPLRDLHIVGPNATHGNDYRPTPRRLVEWVLSGIQACLPGPFEHTTFLDIGSGRGRVLFEAARFPFQRIVGVEFARELHEDAELNLRHWPRAHMRCREVDLVLDDAFDAPLPEGDLVVWMFDPFSDRLMTRMAARLAEHAREARVTLVLVDPRNPMAFRESPTFRALEMPPAIRRRIALLSPYPVRIYTAAPR